MHANNKQKANKGNAIPDHEVRQESSKSANAALQAQQKSKELKDAAAAAGDPDERQKLMERAIDAQIQAESFGKTAKYLRSGTFQGLAVGTGLGIAPGATLGTLTGTLVGGVTSTITGGIGGGVGAVAGALHGPFWDLGKMAGKGVRKVTGDFPGWVASKEQKKTLEKMIGQVQEEDMPDQEELERMEREAADADGVGDEEGWLKSAKEAMPSLQSGDKAPTQDVGEEDDDHGNDGKESSTQKARTQSQTQTRKKPRKLNQSPSKEAQTNGVKHNSIPNSSSNNTQAKKRKPPRKLDTTTNSNSNSHNSSSNKAEDSSSTKPRPTSPRKKPRKLENRSDSKINNYNRKNANASASVASTRGQPRKLEQRSS